MDGYRLGRGRKEKEKAGLGVHKDCVKSWNGGKGSGEGTGGPGAEGREL